MSEKSSWVVNFGSFFKRYYESPLKLTSSMKAESDNDLSTKSIVLIAFGCLLVAGFFILLLVFFLKWHRCKKEKDKNKLEKLARNDKGSLYQTVSYPDSIPLMRADSSLSTLSRDTSHTTTPLSPLSEEEPNFDRGRLEFSVCYDVESECLKTIIIQGHDLPQHHCLFFVEGTMFPDQNKKQRTSVQQHKTSPVFEEMLQFDLPFSVLSEHTLCLTVLELDAFSQEMFVGKVLYAFNMEPESYKVPVKMNMDLSPSLSNDNTSLDPVGELLFSLCYLPTVGRLTLVMMKCRLFQANDGLPNPFIKVSLMLNRKQVKKIKTSVKPKTVEPVYNEAFIFDVPKQHVAKVGLYMRVVNERQEHAGVLGKVVIGPQAKTSLGVHHWECMLLSPRKPLAQWHPIMAITEK